jgi:hypothetical protein
VNTGEHASPELAEAALDALREKLIANESVLAEMNEALREMKKRAMPAKTKPHRGARRPKRLTKRQRAALGMTEAQRFAKEYMRRVSRG